MSGKDFLMPCGIGLIDEIEQDVNLSIHFGIRNTKHSVRKESILGLFTSSSTVF